MRAEKLKVTMYARKDRDNKTFYIGKLKCPAQIDCRDGVAFLFFLADKGEEELQIGTVEPKKNGDDDMDEEFDD